LKTSWIEEKINLMDLVVLSLPVDLWGEKAWLQKPLVV
jgi:hypothetical protein